MSILRGMLDCTTTTRQKIIVDPNVVSVKREKLIRERIDSESTKCFKNDSNYEKYTFVIEGSRVSESYDKRSLRPSPERNK